MKHLLFAFIIVILIAAGATAARQSEQPSGSIKGRITIEGKALPGVAVSLFKEADRYYNRGSLSNVITDADGNYRFTGVAAGRYSVSTYSSLFINTDIDHNGMNGRLVVVDAGEAVEDIDFSLARGGVIRGQLKIEGPPLDGLMMYIAFHHTGSTRLGGGVLVDPRGRFLIEGLPEGEYELTMASETLMRDQTHDYKPQLNAARQTVTVTNGAETPVLLLLDLSKKK